MHVSCFRRALCRCPIALGAVAVVALLMREAPAQLPATRLFSVFPLGAKQGATVELTVTGGADLEGLDALHFSHPGITAVPKTEKVEGKDEPQPVANQFVVTVAPDVPPGVYDLFASGTYGVSNPRAFTVSDYEEIAETEGNNAPEQANEVKVNQIVNGRANGGSDLDYFKIQLEAGQRLIVDCWAQRIDSRLDAVLTLYDPTGKELAFTDNFDHRDPLVDFTAPDAGQYYIELRDQLYNGSNEYVYRLRFTSSYLDYVMPLSVLPGATQQLTLFGRGLPGGTPVDGLSVEGQRLEKLTVSVEVPSDSLQVQRLQTSRLVQPEDALIDGFDYRFKTEAGSTNPVFLSFAAAPTVVEVEPNTEPAQAQQVTAPCEISGQFLEPGDDDWFTFEVNNGQAYWIELFSERIGTPADARMLVQMVTTNDKGEEQVQEVTYQDDNGANIGGLSFATSSKDPVAYRFQAGADGRCRIQVHHSARDVLGDVRYLYRLSIREQRPDFRVVAVPVFPIPQQQNNPNPWTLLVRKGGTAKLDVYAFRLDGFGGEIEVSVEGLPEGVTCPGTIIGAGQTASPLIFTATESAADWVGPLRIVAKAELGDEQVVREVRAGTVIWSVAQGQPAISRLSRALYMAVKQPAPFLVEADRGPRVTVAQSHELYIPIKVTRRDPFKGQLALVPQGVPGNVQKSNLTLNPDQTEAVLPLFVNNNAPVGTYTIYLDASTAVPFTKDGKNNQNVNVIESSTPIIVTITPGPVTLAPNVPNNGQVKRGNQLTIPVTVNRRNNFAGPVTLELLLPPGVSGVKAEPVQVPADQNQANFVIDVAADATVGNHAMVNIRAKMEFGGQTVEVDQTIPLNVQE